MEKSKLRRSQVVKKINQAICGSARGIYADDFWAGINKVQNALLEVTGKLEVEANLVKAEYGNYQDCRPTAKTWTYAVEGYNPEIMVIIRACGAGTVSDPLDKYDVVTYAS